MNNFKKNQQGQMVIIILFFILVGIVVGIFLVNRSTTDISMSTKIEESGRAFNAAEAGIEEAIRAGVMGTSPVPFASGLTYTVGISDLSAPNNDVFPPKKSKPLDVGGKFTVWLVPHQDDGTLNENELLAYKRNSINICFTQETVVSPAVGVILYYKDSAGQYLTSYSGYDPDSARNDGNGLKDASNGAGLCGSAYQYIANVQMGNGTNDFNVDITASGIIPLALRFEPLYNKTSIGVIPQPGSGPDLPKQGNTIESTGKSAESSRKIEVVEHYTVPAPFLDYAVYSWGNADLTK